MAGAGRMRGSGRRTTQRAILPEAGAAAESTTYAGPVEQNRSMPQDVLVPVLGYPSVPEAVAWLTRAFGFTVRWQVADHLAHLGVGPTAGLAITSGEPPETVDHVMVRVDDLDAHVERAMAGGAVCDEPELQPYGERQYVATDPWGRTWVFSQSVADVDPATWGAVEG